MNKDLSAIRLWTSSSSPADPSSFVTSSTLPIHMSTVTQMEFSHSDKMLLSVSRDRFVSVVELPTALSSHGNKMKFFFIF